MLHQMTLLHGLRKASVSLPVLLSISLKQLPQKAVPVYQMLHRWLTQSAEDQSQAALSRLRVQMDASSNSSSCMILSCRERKRPSKTAITHWISPVSISSIVVFNAYLNKVFKILHCHFFHCWNIIVELPNGPASKHWDISVSIVSVRINDWEKWDSNVIPLVQNLDAITTNCIQQTDEVCEYCFPDPQLKLMKKVRCEQWMKFESMWSKAFQKCILE